MVSAPVAGQKRNLAALQFPADIGIGWRSKWRLEPDLFCLRQARHGVQSTAADDPYFRLWQIPSRAIWRFGKLVITQEAFWRRAFLWQDRTPRTLASLPPVRRMRVEWWKRYNF